MNTLLKAKSLMLVTILLLFAGSTMCQTVTGSLKKPQMIKTDDGFLIYGLTKTELQVQLYDKNLKLIAKTAQAYNKGSRNIWKAEVLNSGYLFEMNFCRFHFNKKLEKISYQEWTREDRKAERENSKAYKPTLNASDQMLGKTSHVKIGGFFIEMISNSKVMTPGVTIGGGSGHKGNPLIKICALDESKTPLTYAPKWEIELEHDPLLDYKWYTFNDNLLLYVSGKTHTYLYKVDYANGKIDYKYQMKLDGDEVIAFSNVAWNPDGYPIIVGNFKSADKKAKRAGMLGWFAIRLDSRGQEVAKKKFDFDIQIPKDYHGKDLKERDMNRVCLSMRYMNVNEDNTITMVGEHIRVVTLTSTSTTYTGSGGNTSTTSSGNAYQTFGFSHFELDQNLNVKKSKYIPAVHPSKDDKKGKLNNLLTIGYNFDLFTLTAEYTPRQNNFVPLLNYKIRDLRIVNKRPTALFYKVNKPGEYELYALDLNTSKEVLLKKFNVGKSATEGNVGQPVVTLTGSNKVVAFDRRKTEYTLELIEF